MRYLLLGCTADKSSVSVPIPAIERYNGPAFKTLRRYFRHKPEARADLAIAIVSAKYGLIFPDTLIPEYDQRMEEDLAAGMNEMAITQLKHWMQFPEESIPEVYRNVAKPLARPAPPTPGPEENGDDVDYTIEMAEADREFQLARANGRVELYEPPQFFYMLGKEYRPAVVPEDAWLPAEMTIHRADGGFIAQRTQLLNWLEGRPIPQSNRVGRPLRMIGTFDGNGAGIVDSPGTVRLQGINLHITPEEILAKVEEWLKDPIASYGSTRTRHWTAIVGPYVVAPKWLVSRLSGLHVSDFAAADARRVLQRLGVPMQEHSNNPFLSPSTGVVSEM